MDQVTAFATGVLHDIYAFHCYTMNSVTLFHIQDLQYRRQLYS